MIDSYVNKNILILKYHHLIGYDIILESYRRYARVMLRSCWGHVSVMFGDTLESLWDRFKIFQKTD